MIQFNPRPPEPEYLKSEYVLGKKEKVLNIWQKSGKVNSKKDFSSSIWLHDDVRTTLWEHQNHKCCYCERKREVKRESDVDHFRPKAAVAENADHPGYFWLAYDWDNMLFSCKICNEKYKNDKFPLVHEENRASKPVDDLNNESPKLIDPYKENPEDYIGFEWASSKDLLVKPISLDDSDRGAETIKILGLHSTELMTERADLLLTLNGIAQKMHAGLYFDKPGIIEDAKQLIKEETSSKKTICRF